MKSILKYTLVLTTLIIYSQSSFTQDYYPLKLGNEWFYHYINLPPSDSTISSSVKVLGDSLFSNGLTYFVLDHADIFGGRFVRKDSVSIFYCNPSTGQDQRVFKLDSEVGDTVQIFWGPFMTAQLLAIDTMIVLGIRSPVLTFALDGLVYQVVKFCEQFGPITEWDYGDPPPPWPDYGRELLGCKIDGVHYGITLSVSDQSTSPRSFDLQQNYPNPFNPETNIAYNLQSAGFVQLRIFDCLGREVSTLVNEFEYPGNKIIRWNGRNNEGGSVSSGSYFYELKVRETQHTRKMLFIK